MSDAGTAIAPELRGEVRETCAGDGARLAYRYWAAPGPRSDAAVYLHGIAGHSLWFSEAAGRLAAAGVTVYGADRRGSGLNAALGAGHLPHHEVMLRDIGHFVGLARARHPGRKVFLIAGCWGAKPGVVFAARQQEHLDGLALVAPALSVRITLPPAHLLGVAASLLVDPRRRFPIPLTPEQYTDSPRFRAFIAADPHRLLRATARFYLETARLDRLARAAADRIRLPVLLAQGERDAIVDVAGLRAWFDRVPAVDKALRLYRDSAHILEFEERNQAYFSDLLDWFRAQGAGRERPESAGGRV